MNAGVEEQELLLAGLVRKQTSRMVARRWDSMEFMLWGLVGMGSGWTAGDALWSEVPVLVNHFEAGFRLPAELSMIAQIFTGVALVVLFVRRHLGIGAREDDSSAASRDDWQRKVVWAVICSQIFCIVLLALKWNLTVFKVPVVLFLGMAIAQLAGIANITVIMPYVSTHCSLDLVSATSTGVQLSSMLAGLLGIIQLPSEQHGTNFPPTVYFTCFLVIVVASLFAWRQITSKDLGFSSEDGILKVVSDVESSAPGSADAAATMPATEKVRPPYWLYAMVLPLDMAAWGVTPSMLPFVAGAVAGDCDASNAHAVQILRYAISMSFVALPLAAGCTAVIPTSSLRKLALVAAAGMLAFAAEVAALVPITRASGAFGGGSGGIIIICAHFALRFADTYCVTTAYRLISDMYNTAEDKAHHSESFGILLTVTGLTSTLVTFFLVARDVIHC